jgi:hypothetical protein
MLSKIITEFQSQVKHVTGLSIKDVYNDEAAAHGLGIGRPCDNNAYFLMKSAEIGENAQ